MVESEIEVAAEVGLPFTAKISVRFKRRWAVRAARFLDDVTADAGLSLEQLEERMEADDRLEDLLLQGGGQGWPDG